MKYDLSNTAEGIDNSNGFKCFCIGVIELISLHFVSSVIHCVEDYQSHTSFSFLWYSYILSRLSNQVLPVHINSPLNNSSP